MENSRFSSWFLDKWAEVRDEGLVPYMIVSANRLQLSKTAFTMRASEKIMEEIEGCKFTVDNLGFDIPWFMQRWEEVPEWTPLILDEPNRPASNRAWHTTENQALAEWLQTRAFEHHPAFFPLPHSHLLDNAITGVCTSHVVIDRRGHALVYWYSRDQLNRTYKTRTYYMGELTFDKPYAWDWAEYMERRTDYTKQRGEKLKERVLAMHKQAEAAVSILTVEDVASIVMSEIASYKEKPDDSLVSASVVRSKLKVSYSKAQQASKDVNLWLREKGKAENAA